MRYFIDTNIFLRVLIKSDREQFDECTALLAALKTNKFDAATGSVVLTEIVWTLKSFYDISKQETVRSIKSILGINGLKINDDYHQERAIEFYEKYNVKYVDALIASANEIYERKMIIISYDRDFDKLKVVRYEPKDILKNLTLRN